MSLSLRTLLVVALAATVFAAAVGRAEPPYAPATPATSPSAKFEKEIAAFEAADKISMPPPGAVLFVGDSGIKKWTTLAEDFPDQVVINRGFGGSQMADAVYFADRIVIPYKPRLIVLREGGNDLTAGKSPEQLLADLKAFVDKVHAKLPDTRIAVFSLNPNPARWDQAEKRKAANKLLKAYIAEDKNLSFIEIWDEFLGPDGKPREDLFVNDRLHNNAEGYKLYAAAVKPYLQVAQRGPAADAPAADRHLLYVAVPGIRDDLQYGGHGVLVFDIDHGHQFVRRIAAAGLNAKGNPSNVKGVCANAATGRLYVSTLDKLTCFDLRSDKIIWEKSYKDGCDRMSMSPDGKTMFLPDLEGAYWHVVDAISGDEIDKIVTGSGAHNTIVGPDGKEAYLAGLKSPVLTIADVETHKPLRTVGPFAAQIRPFTIDGAQTHCFVCVNGLLGFEVGDLATGKKLFRVEVQGFSIGKTKRHGCPSHGIGLTPDGRELWVCDAFNRRMHVFDATVMPPKQLDSIPLRDEPGWITFSIDGRFAYPSTGDIVDVKTHKVLTGIKDEEGREVASEKLLEVDFNGNDPVRAGDQFGISRR